MDTQDSGHDQPVLSSIHPGPRDPSVLTLQPQHRSESVWATGDTCPLDVRRSDHGFWSAYPLDVRVQMLLLRAGFYGVYRCGQIHLDHALITALVERWRQETHTFHLPIGEATVTLQDVAVLWGLPIHGEPVIGVDLYRSIIEWQDLCHVLLGFMPSLEDFDGERLKMRAITHFLDTHPLGPDASDIQVSQHARGRVMQLIGCLLGDKSGSKVKLLYLELIRDIDTPTTFSWGSAVLASLYRALCRACTDGVRQICGPLLLLQLWAWERLPMVRPVLADMGSPIRVQPDMPIGPRGCIWNVPRSFVDVGSHVLRSYRGQLDYMLEGEFIWTPYTEVIIQRLPDYCRQGQDVWSASVPLINFDIVEWHFAYRVARQFGLHQEIPPLGSTYISLHRVDRRGRGGQDWRQFHASHVTVWAARMEHVLHGAPTEGQLQFSSEYMTWYRRITRTLIGNPAHHHSQGYRPTASTVEFWGETLGHIFHYSSEAQVDENMDSTERLRLINQLASHALSLVSEDRRMEESSAIHIDASTSMTARGQGRGRGRGRGRVQGKGRGRGRGRGQARDRGQASSSRLTIDDGGASSQIEINIDASLPLFTQTDDMPQTQSEPETPLETSAHPEDDLSPCDPGPQPVLYRHRARSHQQPVPTTLDSSDREAVPTQRERLRRHAGRPSCGT